VDDGLQFDVRSATAATIRDGEEYNGVRVTLTGNLSIAKLIFHIDINVGDPVIPAPEPVAVPKILGGMLRVTGYPLPMVYAEKIVTMLQRRSANTRWRDFADVFVLSRRQPVDGSQLHDSIQAVAAHRQVQALPLTEVLTGYAEASQGRWIAWRRKQQLESLLPRDFTQVISQVTAFADPAITGSAGSVTWDCKTLQWGATAP
jgi:hypothetical protein